MYSVRKHTQIWSSLLIGILCLACSTKQVVMDFEPIIHENLPVPNLEITIPGMSNCTNVNDNMLKLNTIEPVVIIVHGCYSSAANYNALAKVFAFHGQQSICFNYNYRDSMMKSSSLLIKAIAQLSEPMENRKFIIIGHSQGGLVARKALIKEREDSLIGQVQDLDLELITISSPFAGIRSADHCGKRIYLFLTLGLQIPICKMLSGDKWDEITSYSDYIREPGHLIPEVQNFFQMITNEKDSCRQVDGNGQCLEDDYVFSLEEQYYHKIASSPKVTQIEIKAGHTEIIGNQIYSPVKLIQSLQTIGILKPTPEEKIVLFSKMLNYLY